MPHNSYIYFVARDFVNVYFGQDRKKYSSVSFLERYPVGRAIRNRWCSKYAGMDIVLCSGVDCFRFIVRVSFEMNKFVNRFF